MAIIPIVRCRHMAASVAFYTEMLDFMDAGDGEESGGDPSFRTLVRGSDVLFLSSHDGDGTFGQAIVVLVDDVDSIFRRLRERGVRAPEDRRSPVHEGPVEQSWGTREYYAVDPDGNTLRFTERSGPASPVVPAA